MGSPATMIAKGSAGFYRLANDPRNTPSIYPEGFLPLIATDTDDYAGTLGVRGELMSWNWDVSAHYGKDKVDFTIKNSLNRSLGANSPTEFDLGGLRYGQALFNLDVTREVALAARTTIAFGAEYRKESFDIRPGEPASFINGAPGSVPPLARAPRFFPVSSRPSAESGSMKPTSGTTFALRRIDSDLTETSASRRRSVKITATSDPT